MTALPAAAAASPRLLRADLHVHSWHSGFTHSMPMFRSRDCYSTPDEIYGAAKARGMDVVTITDHDSLDGCLEFLSRHPDASDFLPGEEIECRLPDSGVRLHLGVFGLTERMHADVQSLRGDVRDAAAFLRAGGAALVLHHPFHFFRGETSVGSYLDAVLPLVDAVETRNGTMLPEHNAAATAIAQSWRRAQGGRPIGETGGSDAHVLGHVGDSWTSVEAAPPSGAPRGAVPPKDVFLAALGNHRSAAAGLQGTPGRFAFEIYGVVFNYWGGLIGIRRSGLTAAQRLAGFACSVVSLPFQFTPLLVSLVQKRRERRRVARFTWELGSRTTPNQPAGRRV
jgi:predicted metal-dependent phosphoesterase TrpH